ncbi:hypothetical protein VT84_32215 [Gemmata sp. SH-PL17]|uniref:DUF4870 domain-containing protein n=1 Tax=Gemmata sp. SH-PL17 TaxID=1630693 RepID=UPI00078C1A97|nr:DUF4870 domain-containing protein [Gemmata sp. SH-PL17]AMV29104.1 hypothetical protein VT84_32215 [Gemmata sp. SH-PL17]
MSVAEELDKLKKMRDDRTITEEQYERAVAELDAERDEARVRGRRRDRDDYDDEECEYRRPRRRDYDDEYEEELSPRELEKKGREWGLFLHLSLFAGHIIPFGGIIVPIIIWQTKKDELPKLDQHGKNAVNWIISSVLYLLICIPLAFVIVGIPLLIALGVLNVVFPIIAAVRANEGRVWRYPLAISFLS